MYKPKRNDNEIEILGAKEICEKYSIENPKQFIDILALWGDTSDNIPGVPGVGEMTSQKLISKYGSIEKIYENLSDFKGKLKENISSNRETAERARFLVTIETNVPVDFSPEYFSRKQPDYNKLVEIFRELEFNALEKRIIPSEKKEKTQQISLFDEETISTITSVKNDISRSQFSIRKITNIPALENTLAFINSFSNFSFSVDFGITNAHNSDLKAIAICVEKTEIFLLSDETNLFSDNFFVEKMKELFENKKYKKIGFGVKKELQILKRLNIENIRNIFDGEIAHYLLYPEQKHELFEVCDNMLNYNIIDLSNTGFFLANKFKDIDINEIALCEKCNLSFELSEILTEKLKEKNLLDLSENIEFPLIPVLADMEYNGISLDTVRLNDYRNELEKRIKEIEKKVFEYSKTEFNMNSPKQLGEVLFEKMKLIDDPKLTKTKQYSTGESDLVKIADKHPIIDYILNYRTLSKLLNTYAVSLQSIINSKTNKIHTSFNQTGTQTGRLSSSNPNLQNIPIKTDEGKRIRSCFIRTSSDKILVSADYSQIELRLMSHLSCDTEMIAAFRNDEDIHTATAAKIFNTHEVTPEMRSRAKSANFGIIYGISSFGLSENLKISRSDAKSLIDGYFNAYPKIKAFMDKCVKEAVRYGYVSTLFGRRRPIPEIHSKNSMTRSIGERMAINSPVQGTAADIMKLAMINCREVVIRRFPNAKMLLQVHDELVFEIPMEINEEFTKCIKYEMENVVKLNVPLKVNINSGNNWLSAH
jgi:DNA polymerase-1